MHPSRFSSRSRRSGSPVVVVAVLAALLVAGCASPQRHQTRIDRVAGEMIDAQREALLGPSEPFVVDPAAEDEVGRILDEMRGGPQSHALLALVDDEAAEGVRQISLREALRIAARNSREFQARREAVFLAALNYELEVDAFRLTFSGMIDGIFSVDGGGTNTIRGLTSSPGLGIDRRFRNGLNLGSRVTLNLVKLLTLDEDSAYGLLADLSLTLPLLRGSGRERATEPMVQAERNLRYAILEFDRYKRSYLVQIATEYLGVLQQIDQITNNEENYRGLILARRRAARLGEAGRLEEIYVDQAKQDELRARERWITSLTAYARSLDAFKGTLSLPPEIRLRLDRDELRRLADASAVAEEAAAALGSIGEAAQDVQEVELAPPRTTGGGPYELPVEKAVELALVHRVDLLVAQLQLEDAERALRFARDDLRAEMNLTGSAAAGEGRSLGSADQGDASFVLDHGNARAGLELDLPWERTSEAVAYRRSIVQRDAARREADDLSERIRRDIRGGLRDLLAARESRVNQALSLQLAQRRVESTALFLEAGRAEIRDLLEAQEALLSAQNALTSAHVSYRVAELELQRDMGLLSMNDHGDWHEYDPSE